jgi:hypothetical protein
MSDPYQTTSVRASDGHNQATATTTNANTTRTHGSSENRKSSNTRNLVNESSVTRASHDKANIAFTVAFSVPLEGRFPLQTA